MVAIEARILPDDNIQRLSSMRYLAHLYQRDRQSEKAIELLEFILPFEESIFREEHKKTLTTQHNLAYAYADMGQISKARRLLEKVVAVKERILADDDPDLLVSRKELTRISRLADRDIMLTDVQG